MIEKGRQASWQSDLPAGLVVCVIASAPALQLGLTTLLSNIDTVHTVYSASSLDEFETYRSETDILLVSPGVGSMRELVSILDDPGLSGVLFLVDDLDESAWNVPQIPAIPWGILPLEAPIEQFEAAIQAVAAGLSVGVPSAFSFLPADFSQEPLEPLVDPLTGREMEVLQMLAQGKANKQIALELAISEHTVKFHVSSIYTKLGTSNRTEAVRVGVRQGLISL